MRIFAPDEWKVMQVMEMHGLKTAKEAKVMLKKVSRERESFVRKYMKADLNNPVLYDLMINNAEFSREEMLDVILAALRAKRICR